MNSETILHIIPHTHWDREWYMPFEAHRMRLVSFMDTLIDLMERDPAYPYFHLDGQVIVIDDYLEIRPHMRDRLLSLIRTGRIRIGPFYVLTDEYLTSGEANIRNALYGIRMCRALGAAPVMTGYFPDAFGNVSQIPQLLQGFGIDNAVFGRGLNEIGADNRVLAQDGITGSELIWRAPDGSEVMGVMLAGWYSNANELPSDPEALKKRLEQIIGGAGSVAHTPHLLGMNGCDHQPVQKDLARVIETANAVQSRARVEHSHFDRYMEQIRPYKDTFPVYGGEIAGQLTKGHGLLINTASTHVDIKQENVRVQNLLERITEPLSAFVLLHGGAYDKDLFLYAWKRLLQNHPHDSICTCSCDAVYHEMLTRYQKASQVSDGLRDRAMDTLCAAVDTAEGGERNLVVFTAESGRGLVTAECTADYPLDKHPDGIRITDQQGKEVPAEITAEGRTFTYTLPEDRFRRVLYVYRFRIRLQLPSDGGIGIRVFRIEPIASHRETTVTYGDRVLDNGRLRVVFSENGSFTVTDRDTGRAVGPCNYFEDVPDLGDTYNYVPDPTGKRLTTENEVAAFSHKRFAYGITVSARLTLGTTEICTAVTLTEGSDRVEVNTTVENREGSHRLRALFDHRVQTAHVYAEGQFDLVKRSIRPWSGWTYHSNPGRSEHFFLLSDAMGGFLVAHRGLHEYEILQNGKNTAALTLLRCVEEMGDWGVFPTPDARCIGTYTLSYALIPFSKEGWEHAASSGYIYASNAVTARVTDRHRGKISPEEDLVTLSSDLVRIAACKQAEEGDGLILRLYYIGEEPLTAVMTFDRRIKQVVLCNLNEEGIAAVPLSSGGCAVDFAPKKIVTLRLIF